MSPRKRLPFPPNKTCRNRQNAWRVDSDVRKPHKRKTIREANLKFGLTLSGCHKLAFAPFVSFQLPKLARLAPLVIFLRQPKLTVIRLLSSLNCIRPYFKDIREIYVVSYFMEVLFRQNFCRNSDLEKGRGRFRLRNRNSLPILYFRKRRTKFQEENPRTKFQNPIS